MDPVVTGSLISGGASLLGGLFGSKKKAKYVVPDYGKIRARAEAAGFNPLTALTSAPGAVASAGQNYMGQAIADAGLLLADGLAKKAEKTGELQKAREQNAQLKERVQQLTIRPRVGGIYANNVNTPSIRAAVGGDDARSVQNVAGGDASGAGASGAGHPSGQSRPLEAPSPVDLRRGVDLRPVNSSPGFMQVDNPLLPAPLRVPTLDGDEPMHWYDYPDLIVPAAIMGWEVGKPWLKRKIGAEVGPERDLIRFPRSSIPPDQRSAFERINDWRKWWER
ncbi:hypothetical protein [Rhodovulum sp. MB263]|uniref:hypothetical protein n=1 Tax=Rhodovulum sp. (strain MB263) TaxID=308754 RepID=UPI0009B7A607|nr:hypothetical protein [Rhodovulum sp. MB263]ARC88799.1 hypothetical protein B5V46_09295 [Rhodovulum sp. MB263]